MLIQIHMIQNHSPSNLNRDDLGAPKTCYFGGVLRSRISSQCLKRSIRMSEPFAGLLGGVATRRLAQLVAGENPKSGELERVQRLLTLCGIAPKERKGRRGGDVQDDDPSAGRVYTTRAAVQQLSLLVKSPDTRSDKDLARAFAQIIAKETAAPDMALFGRMLEPKKPPKSKAPAAQTPGSSREAASVWTKLGLTVDAAMQAAHALSTHEARPEVDYFVAADDVPGEDSGAAYLAEAMFTSACYYKYFSIHWETLVANLEGLGADKEFLAAHTVGAFLRGAALAVPTGKQNSFAAHNPPDGIAVNVTGDGSLPISYANAFAAPVPMMGPRDLVQQSIAQLAKYICDLDAGYGRTGKRIWFSPNLRFPLRLDDQDTQSYADEVTGSLDGLVTSVVSEIGYDWAEVQKITLN